MVKKKNVILLGSVTIMAETMNLLLRKKFPFLILRKWSAVLFRRAALPLSALLCLFKRLFFWISISLLLFSVPAFSSVIKATDLRMNPGSFVSDSIFNENTQSDVTNTSTGTLRCAIGVTGKGRPINCATTTNVCTKMLTTTNTLPDISAFDSHLCADPNLYHPKIQNIGTNLWSNTCPSPYTIDVDLGTPRHANTYIRAMSYRYAGYWIKNYTPKCWAGLDNSECPENKPVDDHKILMVDLPTAPTAAQIKSHCCSNAIGGPGNPRFESFTDDPSGFSSSRYEQDIDTLVLCTPKVELHTELNCGSFCSYCRGTTKYNSWKASEFCMCEPGGTSCGDGICKRCSGSPTYRCEGITASSGPNCNSPCTQCSGGACVSANPGAPCGARNGCQECDNGHCVNKSGTCGTCGTCSAGVCNDPGRPTCGVCETLSTDGSGRNCRCVTDTSCTTPCTDVCKHRVNGVCVNKCGVGQVCCSGVCKDSCCSLTCSGGQELDAVNCRCKTCSQLGKVLCGSRCCPSGQTCCGGSCCGAGKNCCNGVCQTASCPQPPPPPPPPPTCSYGSWNCNDWPADPECGGPVSQSRRCTRSANRSGCNDTSKTETRRVSGGSCTGCKHCSSGRCVNRCASGKNCCTVNGVRGCHSLTPPKSCCQVKSNGDVCGTGGSGICCNNRCITGSCNEQPPPPPPPLTCQSCEEKVGGICQSCSSLGKVCCNGSCCPSGQVCCNGSCQTPKTNTSCGAGKYASSDCSCANCSCTEWHAWPADPECGSTTQRRSCKTVNHSSCTIPDQTRIRRGGQCRICQTCSSTNRCNNKRRGTSCGACKKCNSTGRCNVNKSNGTSCGNRRVCCGGRCQNEARCNGDCRTQSSNKCGCDDKPNGTRCGGNSNSCDTCQGGNCTAPDQNCGSGQTWNSNTCHCECATGHTACNNGSCLAPCFPGTVADLATCRCTIESSNDCRLEQTQANMNSNPPCGEGDDWRIEGHNCCRCSNIDCQLLISPGGHCYCLPF